MTTIQWFWLYSMTLECNCFLQKHFPQFWPQMWVRFFLSANPTTFLKDCWNLIRFSVTLLSCVYAWRTFLSNPGVKRQVYRLMGLTRAPSLALCVCVSGRISLTFLFLWRLENLRRIHWKNEWESNSGGGMSAVSHEPVYTLFFFFLDCCFCIILINLAKGSDALQRKT